MFVALMGQFSAAAESDSMVNAGVYQAGRDICEGWVLKKRRKKMQGAFNLS